MNYPIIDWELGTKLAGNSREAAEEMLALLVKSLVNDLPEIKQAFTEKKNDKLARQIHRLHGALCYCGTPRLKAVTQQLETAIKQGKPTEINELFNQFESETLQLLATCNANTSNP